jgi:hypothetical protein
MPAKRKSGWTRAGVRHRTPKWYWVRRSNISEWCPALMCLGEDGRTKAWIDARTAPHEQP